MPHICNIDNEKLDRKLKLSERKWTCPVCGTIHDRDINAAINLRNIAIHTVEASLNETAAVFLTA